MAIKYLVIRKKNFTIFFTHIFSKEESKISSLLSRNYYTIAHDLNPSNETGDSENADKENIKEGSTPEAESSIQRDKLLFTADELNFLDAGSGKLVIIVGNPEKAQTPMESYITYEVKTETDRYGLKLYLIEIWSKKGQKKNQ